MRGLGLSDLVILALLPFFLVLVGASLTPFGIVMLVMGGVFLAVFGLLFLCVVLRECWGQRKLRPVQDRRRDRRMMFGLLLSLFLVPVFALLAPFLIAGYWLRRGVGALSRSGARLPTRIEPRP